MSTSVIVSKLNSRVSFDLEIFNSSCLHVHIFNPGSVYVFIEKLNSLSSLLNSVLKSESFFLSFANVSFFSVIFLKSLVAKEFL